MPDVDLHTGQHAIAFRLVGPVPAVDEAPDVQPTCWGLAEQHGTVVQGHAGGGPAYDTSHHSTGFYSRTNGSSPAVTPAKQDGIVIAVQLALSPMVACPHTALTLPHSTPTYPPYPLPFIWGMYKGGRSPLAGHTYR
jgi:hypothetical protein